MTNSTEHPHAGTLPERRAGHPVDESRRRLLRAAAATPLLATIPSGAALAQASAFNCVVTPSKADSDLGAITPSTGLANVNPWARRPAKYRRFRSSQPTGTDAAYDAWSYDMTAASDDVRTWYRVGDPNPLNINWGANCDRTQSFCPLTSAVSTNVRVVAVYLPDDNTSPTSVQAQGYYPLAVPFGEGGPAGNIGLVASCWCSLNPNHITVPGPNGSQSPIDAVCNI